MNTQRVVKQKVIVFAGILTACILAVGCEAVAMGGGSAEIAAGTIKEFKIISPVEATGKIKETEIKVFVPVGTDCTAMKAAITLENEASTITPDPAEPRDYTEPQEFTVHGDDGSELVYTVTIIFGEDSEKAITSFKVITGNNEEFTGTITDTEITVVVPQGTDLAALNASAEWSGKLIQPEPRDVHDFTSSQIFSVYADDASFVQYTVSIISGADIISFKITSPVEANGSIDREKKEIAVTLPAGTAVTALQAAITLSDGTVSPDPATARDYTSDVTYTVSSSYASPINYKVTVSILKPGEYTVIYDPNGATGSQQSETWALGEAKALKAVNTFTKTGYTFSGWKDLAGGSTYNAGESKSNLAVEGATITLYAQWTANTYTVSYNANGGTGSMTDGAHVYGTAKQLSANQFSYAGHIFNGWVDASDATKKYVDEENVLNLSAQNGATVLLKAQWTSTYTVSYNGNGGTGVMPDETHIVGLGSYNIADNKFTSVQSFAGWNTQQDGKGITYKPGVVLTPLTNSAGGTVTLYAIWKAFTVTIKYDLNGATVLDANFCAWLFGDVTLSRTNSMSNSIFMPAEVIFDFRGNPVLTAPAGSPNFAGYSDSRNGQVKISTRRTYTIEENPSVNLALLKDVFPNMQCDDVLTIYAVWEGAYPSGTVTLSSKRALVGTKITATSSGIQNAQGTAQKTWFVGDQVAATGVDNYTPKAEDKGKSIKMRLTYTNGTLDSASTSPVVELMQVKTKNPETGGWIFHVNPNADNDGWTYLEAGPFDSTNGVSPIRYPEHGGKLPFLDYKSKYFHPVTVDELFVTTSYTGLGGGKETTESGYAYNPSGRIYPITKIVYDDAINFYNAGGKTGTKVWYVPNVRELKEMRTVLKNSNLGDFKNATYWSSEVKYGGSTLWVDMNSGNETMGSINESQIQQHWLRPVRRY